MSDDRLNEANPPLRSCTRGSPTAPHRSRASPDDGHSPKKAACHRLTEGTYFDRTHHTRCIHHSIQTGSCIQYIMLRGIDSFGENELTAFDTSGIMRSLRDGMWAIYAAFDLRKAWLISVMPPIYTGSYIGYFLSEIVHLVCC